MQTKSLNVVFFGTPDFAKASLEAIFKSHHKVVGVVTAADKASGRGMKLTPSPVKVLQKKIISTFSSRKSFEILNS
jgi:methionyl-tRNA formyltransferase